MSQERIQIAGIKDANALTAQHISISRTTPDMISKIKIKDIKLYPIRFSNEKMHSTLLYGNQFHIVIRLIDRSQSKIMERMQNVKHNLESPGGIPNFFGHQRFGTTRPITHIVGRHIVQGRWEEAALAFLAESSEYEHPESRQARQQLWQERNFSEALHYFPSQLKYERIMLSHLARHPKESVNAFRRLPIKLCELFVQAYQSYLFNKFLSQRMKLRMSISQPQDGDFTVKVNKKEHLALPIIGFKQSQSSGDQGKIEREILEKEKVAPQQFRIALMPEISAAGGIRTALSPIMDFSIGEPNIDSANPSKRMVRLGFMLGKGSYATVALREFMKSGNPVDAGF
jgi:tRNA pseudouridine13 synthase